MRKITLTFLLLMMAAGIANAQWYMGGNIALALDHSSEPGRENNQTFFAFNPRIGYMIENDMVVGAELTIGTFRDRSISTSLIGWDRINQYTVIGLKPYFRYNFFKAGGFTVGAETGIGFYNLSIRDVKDNGFGLGIDVTPVVSFPLSRKVSFETHLDIFRLNYLYGRVKEDGDLTETHKLAFGVFGDSVFRLGKIRFGIVYKF